MFSDSKRLIGWHVLHDLPIAEDRQLWTFNADTRNVEKHYFNQINQEI